MFLQERTYSNCIFVFFGLTIQQCTYLNGIFVFFSFWKLPRKLIKLLYFDFPENASLLHFPYEFQWFQWKNDSKSKGPPFDNFKIFMISTFQIGISRKCKFASFPWWISMISMKYVVKFKGPPFEYFQRFHIQQESIWNCMGSLERRRSVLNMVNSKTHWWRFGTGPFWFPFLDLPG